MSRPLELTNQRFGKLIALNRITVPVGSIKTPWLCKCDCGNYSVVGAALLSAGKTKSCGCMKNEKHDLRGQKFGSLFVLKRNKNEKGDKVWECLCDCGNIINLKTAQLLNNNITSCDKCCKESQMGSKAEVKIAEILKSNGINFIQEYSFPDLVGKVKPLRFDFAIFGGKELLCLIEYQGDQHYHPVDYFGGEERFEQQ